MKCPNCGALIENDKTKCFMCGTDLDSNNYNEISNNNFVSNDGFGSGTGYSEEYLQKKEAYDNRFNDYKNVKMTDVPASKKDVFDFFSEHKKGIKITFLILLVALIIGGIFIFVKGKNKEVVLEPVLLNLYYKVEDDFIAISENNNSRVYTKSGTKGSDCSISVSYTTSTSENHVEDFYNSAKKVLEPEKDKQGNIINQEEVFQTEDNEMVINDTIWYYMSVYYRSNVNVNQFDFMKYRYYTSVYKGYFYDIELANNSNSTTCNASLDNFISSLKFIDN